MSDVWLVVLSTLAAFFVSWVFTSAKITEPFMEPIRWRFERRWQRKHGAGSDEEWNSKLAYLLSCVKCLGFWVSGVTTVVVSTVYGIDYPLLTWLAMSGVIVILGGVVKR